MGQDMPISLARASLSLCVILASASVAVAQPPKSRGPLSPAQARTVALQVALDRAGFSPGEIDGAGGPNLKRALAAFAATHGVTLDPSGPKAAELLGGPLSEPLTQVVLTDADLAGPFVDAIPTDLLAQASLEALAYASPLEMIAERFHASPRLLARLNPNVQIAPGATLVVPAVEPFVPPTQPGKRPPSRDAADRVVRISEQAGGLEVREGDRVLFFAPVTVGGVHDPLPVGEWKVTQVFDRPVFNYNPDLFWDADPSHAKAKIAPGPNNPVGLTWIGLDKEHYGIHGTPEPSRIGHVQSHGCIRLTNWDAVRVAGLVSEGTRVVLER